MAYTLDQAQEDALRTERDNLQGTIDGYDTQNFIDSVNNGVIQAEEVDEGFERVFTSFHSSVDGAVIREREIDFLDGTLITDPIDNELDALIEMGQITPVINQITERATPALSSEIESSALIRENINRFYPDADDENDAPGFPASTTDIFPGPSWYSLLRRNETNVFGRLTTSQPFLANNGTAFTATVMQDGQEVLINQSERFLLFYLNLLSNPASATTTDPNGPSGNATITLIDFEAVIVGGVGTIVSESTMTDTTYSADVGDVISISNVPVQIILASANTVMTTIPASSMGGMDTDVFTTTSQIEFLKLSNQISSNGSVTVASNFNLAGQAFIVSPLRRFPDTIDTQQDITDRIPVIESELSTIYEMRYLAANSRANWNNGSLSALQSRLSTRLNLLSPDNLFAMGLIPDALAHINEYTRAEDRIAYINEIFTGNTPPIVI